MSGIFSKPDVPQVPNYPKPPDEDDEEIKRREREERQMLRLRQGRRSTILTSGSGDTSKPNIKRNTLLGGAK
jgi:hypothetical protein